MPTYSIVIRSHNDRPLLEQVLAGLRSQTCQDFEVIFCDDNSTDGSLELIATWPEAISLPPEVGGYVPGKVLNRAVRAASGQVVIFNNSDSVIMHPEWLENLTRPLSDSQVASSFARQLPRQDAWPLVKKDYQRAFGDGSISRQWRHFFSLVSAAMPRSLLLEQPFREDMQASEDIEWSWRMRQLGRKLVYAQDAVVEHSHNYTPKQLWRRFYMEGFEEAKIFGERPNLWRSLRRTMVETARDVVYCAKHGHWQTIFLAPAYRVRQQFAQYQALRHACQQQNT